ncbi:hypothetical protein [uncultured Arthrobacter sp.]|uniref:hypothetical protein n=1 Tax=uncultured Arthrobacter sp. TaxID=114050 RepID=UPI0026037479|nr:hypothetical protein [uncultured Arthrobacter sp.]
MARVDAGDRRRDVLRAGGKTCNEREYTMSQAFTGEPGAPAPGADEDRGDPGAAEPDELGASGPSSALLGPFTLREVVFGGGVLVMFVGTLLPFIGGALGYVNFWNTAPLFYIGIGILLPVAACALLAGRRMGTSGLRVGSLSVDQFASVTAVLAAVYFFLQTVTVFGLGSLLGLIGSLALIATTVVGPYLPVIRNDFLDRPEVPAHRLARPATAARPRPAKPPKASDESLSEARSDTVADGPGTSSRVFGDDPSAHSASDDRVSDHRGGINPAVAIPRQNGAGLYGAGAAGAVGAGVAASGQSGLAPAEAEVGEPNTTGAGSARSDSAGQPSRATAEGSHAVERDAARDEPVAPAATGTDVSDAAGDAVSDTDATGTDTENSDDDGASTTRSPVIPVDEAGLDGVIDVDHPKAQENGSGPLEDAAEESDRRETITATRSAQDDEPVVEAFWFAVGSPRPVLDEQSGRELFILEPGDWEVGIEDRGNEFLVQDKRTGMVGILQDLRNIERAPRD